MSGIRDFTTVPIPTDDETVLELYPYLSDNQARLRLDCEQYPLQLSWRKGKYFCCWCGSEEFDDYMFRLGTKFREINGIVMKGPYR